MLVLFFLLVSLVGAFPNPGPCNGNCWTHDPSMIQRQSDGMYFRFATGFGVNTMTSKSLRGPWKDVGAALPSGSSIILDGVNSTNIWGPDVHFENNQYWMYYCISQKGTQNSQIGVASSDTLEPGTWIDHGVVGLPANTAWNRIDPTWVSINGKSYLNFGSFWTDIYQIDMDTPLKVAATTPRHISYNATLNHRQEGVFMFKHNSFYYLLISCGIGAGYTATKPARGAEYHIRVCRSSTGTGGFVDQSGQSCLQTGGTLLLASHDQVYGPGGPGILFDSTLGPVLYYHYYPFATKMAGGTEGTAGYRYAYNTLGWKNDWPFVTAA